MREERSLLLHNPHQLVWVQGVLPEPGPDDLLLRTRAGAISIGTELPYYRGYSRSLSPPSYPLMTGYESLAEVVACGATVQDIKVGERVIAFYGHRTAAVVPASRVVPVPTDIPDQLALLVILACDTAKGVAKVPVQPSDHILIAGAGAIGLLTLFNLHARGARHIDVLEPLARRRTLADRLGARASIDPGTQQPTPNAYHLGFECSSRNDAFHALQDALLPNGHLCILSDGNLEPLTLSPAFHAKELSVVGSSDGLDYRHYARWFWAIVREQRHPLALLFEQTTTAEALPQVFESLAQNTDRPVKVLVRYER